MKKQKRKMNKKMMEEEKHDWMQEWKERGRMKPFTEEGIEEAQYAAMFMNYRDEKKEDTLINKIERRIIQWYRLILRALS